jgi:probable rRNA maturation factor
MINLKNSQRTIDVDVDQFKRDAQKILDLLEYSDFDLGIWLTTNHTIRRYNRDFRDKDRPTDILSFPYHTELVAGDRIVVTSEDDKNLGDIIISPEYVLADLERWEKTFEERMRILLVHGICHLLAYDHIKDEDYAVMHEKEAWLLSQLEKS